MTIEELELKKWLNRAFYAENKINVLKECVQQCRERAESVSVCWGCNDKGKSSGSKNGTENALMKLADLELKFTRQMNELAGITSEISKAISLLDDNDLETVLMHRYILFHSLEETSKAMNYSVRSVKYKQNQAIKKLCPLLPSFALDYPPKKML